MSKLDAIVLAGDMAHSTPVGEGNKCFLQLGARPLIEYALEALDGASAVGDVYVVGPRAQATGAVHAAERSKNFKVVEQGETIVENVRRAYRAKCERDAVRREGQANPYVLIISADMPLITGAELDRFAKESGYRGTDCVLAFASERGLSRFYPWGLRTNYIFLRQFVGRINNMLIVNVSAVKNLDYVSEAYRLRYQKHVLNFVKYVWTVLFSKLDRAHLILAALVPELCLQLQRLGLVRAARFLARFNDQAYFERAIGAVFGMRFKMVCLEGAVGALDVDSVEELQIFRENLDELKALAQSLSQEARSAPLRP